MLKAVNRLKKRKEFAYLYTSGTAKHASHLTMVYLPTKKRATKIGFSISKKVGKAHTRNLIKRRLRAIVREIVPSLPDELNIVFIAKVGIESVGFDKLKDEVNYLIKKAGIIKDVVA